MSTPSRTPTRAITSTLSSRSSPPVPPASQTYVPLLKTVLRNRLLYTVFAYSAVFNLAVDVFFLDNDDNVTIVNRLFTPATWVAAMMSWIAGVLPIIVLRKIYLTTTPTAASSPSLTFRHAFAKSSTRRALLVYLTSAMISTILYITTSYGNDAALTVFVKSRKHPYYLNGSFVFLLLSQIWMGGFFFLRNILLDRDAFRCISMSDHGSQSARKWLLSVTDILKIFITVVLLSSFSFTLYVVCFGFVRMFILPTVFGIPGLHGLLKPFASHFLRGPWTLVLPIRYFDLMTRSFCLGITTLAKWEFAEALFDVHVPQATHIAKSTADPGVTLVSAITSSDLLFKQFAYFELLEIATDESSIGGAQRTALFVDQKFSPNLWSTLARESLLMLGHHFQLFLRRGGPAPAAAPPQPAPTKQPDHPSTPLIRQSIYKAAHQSPLSNVLDTFASDSKSSKLQANTTQTILTKVEASSIPELFRSIMPSPTSPTKISAVTKPNEQQVAPQAANLLSSVTRHPFEIYKNIILRIRQNILEGASWYSPPQLRQIAISCLGWWQNERVSRIVEKSLPHRNLDALAIDVLSHLVCSSLTEDRFGVVQRDIPRILEAFVSFLSAVEEYQAQVSVMYVPPTPDELNTLSAGALAEKENMRIEVAAAAEALAVVGDALKMGIVRIIRTFGDKLLAFKFPPITAQKLQGFVDYN